MRNKLVSLMAVVGLLTGCAHGNATAVALHAPDSPGTALLVLDGISVINTSKTVEDHVIGWITGQDCSLVRASMGYDYCEDNSPKPMQARTTYCYGTLGKVSCYDRKLASDESRFIGTRQEMVPVLTQ